jgi:molybdate transport system permease protein
MKFTAIPAPFTFPAVVLASCVFNLPFAVRPFLAGFEAVDRTLVEASWCLGVSRWRTFWRVTLPLARPGIAAGLFLTAAHVLGEFGTVLIVGGSIPGETRTVSVAVYEQVKANDPAAQHSAGAIFLAAVALLLLGRLAGRGLRWRSQ